MLTDMKKMGKLNQAIKLEYLHFLKKNLFLHLVTLFAESKAEFSLSAVSRMLLFSFNGLQHMFFYTT